MISLWGKQMEQHKMADAIKEGLLAYELIVGKEVHYIYEKDNQYKEIVLLARRNDFMHLCGVKAYLDPKTKRPVTKGHFYNLVKTDKISPSFLVIKSDGTTVLKLGVIKYLKYLLSPGIRVIDGEISLHNFTFETGLRTGKEIFALALIETDHNSSTFSPFSLLDLKVENGQQMKGSYKVHSVFIRDRYGNDEIQFVSPEYKIYLEKETGTS